MTKVTRRRFVRSSLQGSAALAAASVLSAPNPLQAGSANDKVVLGLIGAGGRGRYLACQFAGLESVEVKYVSDVEDARGKGSASEIEKIQGFAPRLVADMREMLDDKDLDAVIVGTPEQWHALATIWACQAGKDVFVEKNISHTIWEGRKMIEAARKYKRVVQAGFQCRSAPYVHSARDYIAEGGLGEVLYVKAFNMLPFVYGSYPKAEVSDGDPPAGLDWDRWLGPADERPYNVDVHRKWYGYWDFSGGNASDAIHTLDAARLVIGDPPHPKSVTAAGGRWQYNDGGEMPDVEIATFQFDRLVMTFENTGFTPYMFKTPGEIRAGDQFPFWPRNSSRIEIYGTKRMMYLGRHGGGWQVYERGPQELEGGFGTPVAQEFGRFPDEPHIANFVDCIRSREKPNGDVEVCHYSACIEHLANTAYRVGNRQLLFDGDAETFTNCDEANRLQRPAYRKHYRVPEEV